MSAQPIELQKIHRSRRRDCGATSIAEFGPALLLLLICLFFPLLDLLSLCFDYGMVMVLNYNQAHEAALLPSDQVMDPNGAVRKGIVDQWLNGPMGRFLKVNGPVKTEIEYKDGAQIDDKNTEKIITVKTSVSCLPFLSIPFPGVKIAGLNDAMLFFASSECQMEDPDNAGPTK
ncbi:MAG: hypothetical protein K2X93_16335 [Candidatus Obscuribacterales bacterium]|nr:hypothetical protein [Candidatus Obscuribacterales bacterium]